MRMVTGAILILAAEQAVAHAHLIQFPHEEFALDTLLPAGLVVAVLGVAFLLWGTLRDAAPSRAVQQKDGSGEAPPPGRL